MLCSENDLQSSNIKQCDIGKLLGMTILWPTFNKTQHIGSLGPKSPYVTLLVSKAKKEWNLRGLWFLSPSASSPPFPNFCYQDSFADWSEFTLSSSVLQLGNEISLETCSMTRLEHRESVPLGTQFSKRHTTPSMARKARNFLSPSRAPNNSLTLSSWENKKGNRNSN